MISVKVQNFFSHKIHNFASEENGKSSTRNSKTSLDLLLLKKTVVVELLKRMKGESELFLRKKKRGPSLFYKAHLGLFCDFRGFNTHFSCCLLISLKRTKSGEKLYWPQMSSSSNNKKSTFSCQEKKNSVYTSFSARTQ